MLMSMAERDVAMERPDVSCLDCVNSLFFCFGECTDGLLSIALQRALYICHVPRSAGPVHQFDRYYKDGHFDNCQKKFTELSFCFKLKAAGREEAKVGRANAVCGSLDHPYHQTSSPHACVGDGEAAPCCRRLITNTRQGVAGKATVQRVIACVSRAIQPTANTLACCRNHGAQSLVADRLRGTASRTISRATTPFWLSRII